MVLTLDEIMDINQNAEFDSAIGFARAIESAVLEKLKAQAPFGYFSISYYGALEETSGPTARALYEHPDPRVAELEAVLQECREALVPYMKYVDGTSVLNHPAQCVAKIDAVLPKTLG